LRGRSDKPEARVAKGLHIAVVDDDDVVVDRINAIFPEYDAERVDHLDDVLKNLHGSTVVVIGPSAVNEDTFEQVEAIRDGGPGTTSVAVNLAAAARDGEIGPIVVDADLPFGDVAITLGLDPARGLADATGSDMDLTRLRALLTADASTGLRALLAPADPAR